MILSIAMVHYGTHCVTTAASCRWLHSVKIASWISNCFWMEIIQLSACWQDFSREEVNKWKGCIVFPEDTEQTGWGHRDHSLSCSDDDGAPHWITVDSASTSSTYPLPSIPAFSNIFHCVKLYSQNLFILMLEESFFKRWKFFVHCIGSRIGLPN